MTKAIFISHLPTNSTHPTLFKPTFHVLYSQFLNASSPRFGPESWTRKRGVDRDRICTTPPRNGGNPSGGRLASSTRHIESFFPSKRGQGGPRGKSAGRYGDIRADGARGLEVQREGCESMCPEWSNGSFEAFAILAITLASTRMGASAGQKTFRGRL